MSSNTAKMALLGSAATALHMPGAATAETHPEKAEKMTIAAAPPTRVEEKVAFAVSIKTERGLPRYFPVRGGLLGPAFEALRTGAMPDCVSLPALSNPPRSNTTVASAGVDCDKLQQSVENSAGVTSVSSVPFSSTWLAADLRKDIAAALHVDPSVVRIQELTVVVTAKSNLPDASAVKSNSQWMGSELPGALMWVPHGEASMHIDIDFRAIMPARFGVDQAEIIREIQGGRYATSQADLNKAKGALLQAYGFKEPSFFMAILAGDVLLDHPVLNAAVTYVLLLVAGMCLVAAYMLDELDSDQEEAVAPPAQRKYHALAVVDGDEPQEV